MFGLGVGARLREKHGYGFGLAKENHTAVCHAEPSHRPLTFTSKPRAIPKPSQMFKSGKKSSALAEQPILKPPNSVDILGVADLSLGSFQRISQSEDSS